MKKLLYAVIFLVVLVIGLTFALKNPAHVNIQYYFGVDFNLPLTLLLLVCLAVGILLGYFVGRLAGYRRRRRDVRPTARAAASRTKSPALTARSG